MEEDTVKIGLDKNEGERKCNKNAGDMMNILYVREGKIELRGTSHHQNI